MQGGRATAVAPAPGVTASDMLLAPPGKIRLVDTRFGADRALALPPADRLPFRSPRSILNSKPSRGSESHEPPRLRNIDEASSSWRYGNCQALTD